MLAAHGPQPATCDITDGLCYSDPVDDGTACNDNDIATEDDTCTAGVCQGVDRCLNVQCPDLTCSTGTCVLGYCEYSDVRSSPGSCRVDPLHSAGCRGVSWVELILYIQRSPL